MLGIVLKFLLTSAVVFFASVILGCIFDKILKKLYLKITGLVIIVVITIFSLLNSSVLGTYEAEYVKFAVYAILTVFLLLVIAVIIRFVGLYIKKTAWFSENIKYVVLLYANAIIINIFLNCRLKADVYRISFLVMMIFEILFSCSIFNSVTICEKLAKKISGDISSKTRIDKSYVTAVLNDENYCSMINNPTQFLKSCFEIQGVSYSDDWFVAENKTEENKTEENKTHYEDYSSSSYQSQSNYNSNKKEQEKSDSFKSQKSNDAEFEPFSGCNDLQSVKERYRALMKIYHPDINGGNTEIAKKINEKYDELIKLYK